MRSTRLPWALRALDRAAGWRDRLGMPATPFSAKRLIARACRRTGLHDLGSGPVLEALKVLVQSFEHEARLSRVGHILVRAYIQRVLETRLRIIDTVAREPDVRREEVRRPMFVVGFPRTGTTLLFNLLAQDPEARPLLSWEAYLPVPPRRFRERRRDPRIARHHRRLRNVDRVLPRLREMHPLDPEGPEECLPLLLRTFVTWTWLFNAHLPSYGSWLWEQPLEIHEETYRFHCTQLQLLQWQHGGKRWLLKSPAHLNGLAALLRVYPDACVIQTHRDLRKVLPSTCSLFGVVRGLFSGDVDPNALGHEVLALGERSLQRCLALRCDGTEENRIYDVRFDDLMADPQRTVERIHDHFGLPVSDVMRNGMRRWMQENPRHKHGVHRYSLQQFGLDESALLDGLKDTVSEYRETFGV